MRESGFVPSDDRLLPMRGVSFWLLAAVLAFSPLPFASVGAIWTWVYSVIISLALLVYLAQRRRRDRGIPGLPRLLYLALALVLTVSLLGYLQAVPGLFPSMQHPVWAQTAALIQSSEMPGYLSIVPNRSVLVATSYLTYIGFALLVAWHGSRQRNAELLLKIFIGTQAVYVAYGLFTSFAGQETILWFEKAAYRGVLTSTFVNRNSYATYAGLGALASLALILRFLRHTLVTETSRHARFRDFIEVLTSSGWLLPVVLVMCIVAVLLTGSRMGLTAMLVAASVLLLGWTVRLPRGQARTFGGILVVVLIALLMVNFVLSGGLTADRFSRFFEDGDGRFLVYPLMLDAISERPWTGYGLGTFASAFRLVRDDTIMSYFDRGHSDYLELVMDVGWPAAGMIVAGFLILLIVAWQASRRRTEYEFALLSVAATVQIGIHSAVDFSMQMPAVVFAYLVVALVGAGAGASPRRVERPAEESDVGPSADAVVPLRVAQGD